LDVFCALQNNKLEDRLLNLLSRKTRFAKTAVAAVIAGGLLFFVSAPPAHAGERENCQHAIEKAEVRLDKAIHDKGEHSRDADDRRRELNTEREHCWSANHQWWNGKDHRWETEHNWDR
jgi:hypothetical protein